jgi:hypothetical protein
MFQRTPQRSFLHFLGFSGAPIKPRLKISAAMLGDHQKVTSILENRPVNYDPDQSRDACD